MEELITYILKGICSHPDKVEVTKEEDNGLTILTISAEDEDIGRIIGRGGKNIKALQTLISLPARKENKRVILKVKKDEIQPL